MIMPLRFVGSRKYGIEGTQRVIIRENDPEVMRGRKEVWQSRMGWAADSSFGPRVLADRIRSSTLAQEGI
jgi:hypothetical protein